MMYFSSQLLAELTSPTPHLCTAWLLVRDDGQRFAFTSWDKAFFCSIDGGVNNDLYLPVNSMAASAAVAKSDLSVANATATALISDTLTVRDLDGGLFDNAKVKIFWVNPDHPEYGIVPIQGGRLGEVSFHNVKFEAELRSVAQVIQQP